MCPLSLRGYAEAATADSQAALRRRRLSRAVARRLARGVTWLHTPEAVAERGRALSDEYLRCGTPYREDEEQEAVARELRRLTVCLRRAHPNLFGSVLRNVGGAGGQWGVEGRAGALLGALGGALFEGGVTWGRVAALFALAGALADDCRPDLLPALARALARALEGNASLWISRQGGWASLLNRFERSSRSTSAARAHYVLSVLTCLCAVLCGLLLLMLLRSGVEPGGH